MSSINFDLKTRKLTWSDVQAKLAWVKNDGKRRVFASLKMCSFVNTTLWCDGPDLESPTLQAAILLNLHRNLRKTVHKLKTYQWDARHMSTDEIAKAVAESFPSFGGGKLSQYNPIVNATANKPPMFAAGADIKEVVNFVLERAGIGRN